MDKITDSRAVAEGTLDNAYRTMSEVPAERAIAAAIVWAGFKISEEIAKLGDKLETKASL